MVKSGKMKVKLGVFQMSVYIKFLNYFFISLLFSTPNVIIQIFLPDMFYFYSLYLFPPIPISSLTYICITNQTDMKCATVNSDVREHLILKTKFEVVL